MKGFVLFLFLLLVSKPNYGQLLINEVLTDNFSSLKSSGDEYFPWVEIYNSTDEPISLRNWKLSNQSNQLSKWLFPDITIESKKFVLIVCSGRDKTEGNQIHCNFILSNLDTRVFLTNPAGEIVDQVGPINLSTNNSYGRLPDGSANRVTLKGSSPESSNNNMNEWFPLLHTLTVSPQGGFYPQDSILISFSVNNIDAEVYFTLDGSEPTPNDFKFENDFYISSTEQIQAKLAYIKTTSVATQMGKIFEWKYPNGNVRTSILIRAQAFINNKPVSQIQNATYFIGENSKPYTLPLFSLVVNKDDLFGDKEGIYVPGDKRDNLHDVNWFTEGGNFFESGPEWERPVEVSIFDLNGNWVWQQRLGVRIHGFGSRYFPQKSLRLYARNQYSTNSMNHRLFPQSFFSNYRHVLLRNSGQDITSTFMADALSCSFYSGLNFDYQLHSPVIHFINGEYWGIANLRERVHERYVAYKNNVNHNDVILFELFYNLLDGGDPEYGKLLQFVKTHNMNTTAAYEYIVNKIDVANYIDYNLGKIFVGAYDWPGNNLRIWRLNKPDYKFRWLMFDTDEAFNTSPEYNTLLHALEKESDQWPNPAWSTLLLRKFLENDSLKKQFISRAEQLIRTKFSTENMLNNIDSFENMYAPEISEHIRRWQMIPSELSWKNKIEVYRSFAYLRPCYLKKHFTEVFKLKYNEFLPEIDCEHIMNFDDLAELEIIGNPSYSSLVLKINVETTQDVEIKIFAPDGRLIYEEVQSAKSGQNIFPINFDLQIPQGVYYVAVFGETIKTGEKWLRFQD